MRPETVSQYSVRHQRETYTDRRKFFSEIIRRNNSDANQVLIQKILKNVFGHGELFTYAAADSNIQAFFQQAELTNTWRDRGKRFYLAHMNFKPALLVLNDDTSACPEFCFYKGAFYFHQFCTLLPGNAYYDAFDFKWLAKGDTEQAEQWLNLAISCGSLPAYEAKLTVLIFRTYQTDDELTKIARISEIQALLNHVLTGHPVCGAYLTMMAYVFLQDALTSLGPHYNQLETTAKATLNQVMRVLLLDQDWLKNVKKFIHVADPKSTVQIFQFFQAQHKRELQLATSCGTEMRLAACD